MPGCFLFFLTTEVTTSQCNGELKITRNSNTNSLKLQGIFLHEHLEWNRYLQQEIGKSQTIIFLFTKSECFQIGKLQGFISLPDQNCAVHRYCVGWHESSHAENEGCGMWLHNTSFLPDPLPSPTCTVWVELVEELLLICGVLKPEL